MTGPYSIYLLGDEAITVELGHEIEEHVNRRTVDFAAALRRQTWPGIRNIVTAFNSVSVFYDPIVHSAHGIKKLLMELLDNPDARSAVDREGGDSVLIRIPVCYEAGFGPDLAHVAARKGLSQKEIVDLHISRSYRVYMVGFLPGFPYMGKVDDELAIGRKERPVPVTAGGVGIAGYQTGIYPLNSPGGWQIIGRTPLTLFDPYGDPPVRLRAGDRVQFYPIGRDEFQAGCSA